MKISVIIPCYNAADTLGVQLDALAGQDWSHSWEVILSDNGSTDDSRSIALEYRDKLPNLSVVDASGVQGPSHARNQGALAAKGESLLFCDADDEVADGWLAAMGDALEDNDFITCRFESAKLSESWARKARMCPQEDGIQTYDYPPFLPHAASAAIGVKRRIHEAVGGFDETMPMLEDTDYCWRIQLRGTELVFVEDALIHYRLRGSVRKMMRQSKLWGQYNVYLYRKYREHGMPVLSRKAGIKKTWWLLKQMPYCITNSKKRLPWLWNISWQYGRTVGSIKYRVLAL